MQTAGPRPRFPTRVTASTLWTPLFEYAFQPMRIFALSDIHIDYDANARWVAELSAEDYRDDVLILAGDVSDSLQRLRDCLHLLARRFKRVLYVPGNHDLWVRGEPALTSLDKLAQLRAAVGESGASMDVFHEGTLSIVPLLSWYDFSFGAPSRELLQRWVDFRACRWPGDMHAAEVAAHFQELNVPALETRNDTVISFSHFLPRIDLMPDYIPADKRMLYPILGSEQLERQVRQLRPRLHVYGHSHVNRRVVVDGIKYVNNAFGYPHETRIAARKLVSVHEHG